MAARSLVGMSLDGRYDVLELLGEGGMGAVYRALDRELDEVIALKVIRDEMAGSAGIVERFRNEVKLARRVTHANVARTYELGHAGGMVFCTMELVDGEPLKSVLKRRGRLPIEESIAIAVAVTDGLVAAHAVNVIHRDIKPDNVLIARDGRVVVTDFGIASLGRGPGESAGTPHYMAPEQERGEPPSPAADIYAVGVMLFEMVTGTRAFTGSPAEISAAKQRLPHLVVTAEAVPSALADVIVHATERDPSRRTATAAALCAALAPWLVERDVECPAPARAGEPELPVVIVRAPSGDSPRGFIVEAVHGELLHHLAQTPRLRVLTHGDARGLVVELAAGDALTVTIAAAERAPLVLQLPLEVGHVGAAASSIAGAIVGALEPPRAPDGATELLLRARHHARDDLSRLGGSMELLEQARELAPEDPRIAAALALALLQRSFFDPTGLDARAAIDRATELVKLALAAGPAHHETHLAAGQLELHVGEAAYAAGHFRLAIACAPHEPFAHEQLGRMLLEAGYLEAGFARIEEALALAPDLHAARWQVARAHALERRWAEHARVLGQLAVQDGNAIGQLRALMWRDDVAAARALRPHFRVPRMFPEIFEAVFAVLCDGRWPELRERLCALATEPPSPSRRQRAFVAQLVAELAGLGGDDASAEQLVRLACDCGLFDLHWLDKAPTLAGMRERPAFAALRAEVKRRADAVLDALYGDHPVAPPSRTEIVMRTRIEAGTVRWK